MLDKMILSVSLFAVLLIGTVSVLPIAEGYGSGDKPAAFHDLAEKISKYLSS